LNHFNNEECNYSKKLTLLVATSVVFKNALRFAYTWIRQMYL